jgi:hypothetical protein
MFILLNEPELNNVLVNTFMDNRLIFVFPCSVKLPRIGYFQLVLPRKMIAVKINESNPDSFASNLYCSNVRQVKLYLARPNICCFLTYTCTRANRINTKYMFGMSWQRCQHFQVSEDAYRMQCEINT